MKIRKKIDSRGGFTILLGLMVLFIILSSVFFSQTHEIIQIIEIQKKIMVSCNVSSQSMIKTVPAEKNTRGR